MKEKNFFLNRSIEWEYNYSIYLFIYSFSVQKISPDGKSKIQLQVVLHDGTSSTFHFVNRNGQEAQVKDRDDVKELLQQLLPKFKRKVNKELEEKNKYDFLYLITILSELHYFYSL